MLRPFVKTVVRYPILTISIVTLMTFFFAYQIWNPWMAGRCLVSLMKDETACWWSWKLKMVVDPKTILPQDHPYVKLNDRIEKKFGGSRVVVIGIEPGEGDVFNPKTLSDIRQITDEVKNIPGIKEENVVSIADRKVKYVESRDDTIKVERLMEQVPRSEQEIKGFKERVFANDLYIGSLISRDGKAAAIITDFREWVPAANTTVSGMSGEAQAMETASGSNPWWGGDTVKSQEANANELENRSKAEGSKQGANPWWPGEKSEGSEGQVDDGAVSRSSDSAKDSGENPWRKEGDSGQDSAAAGSAQSSGGNPWWPGGTEDRELKKQQAHGESSGPIPPSDSGSDQGSGENPWWPGESSGESWPSGGGYSGFRMSDSAIYAAIQKASAAVEEDGTRVYIGGLPVALAFMEKDSARIIFLFPLAMLIMMVILYWAFRSFQGMIIPLLTALCSVVWALGLMGLAGIPMDPFNTLTPILILAVAAGHSIQILKRYYEELALTGDNKTAVIEATAKIAPVTITAAVVAAASFSSLITFQLKTFQAFGLFTAFGILSALVLELTLIPALRSVLRPPRLSAKTAKEKNPKFLDRILVATGQWTTSGKSLKIAVGSAIILGVALIGTLQVRVDNSLKSQFFETTRLRMDERALNQHFGGTSTFYILVEGNRPLALKHPAVLAAIDRLQNRLEAVPGVGKTESYVDYVKKMNQTFHQGDPSYDRVPEDRQLVNDFLFLYSISGNPADFARLVDYDYQEAVIWSYLKSDSTLLAEELIRIVEEFAKENSTLFISVQDKTPKAQWADQRNARVEPVAAGLVESHGDDAPRLTLGVAGSAPVTVALNRTMVEGKIKNILQIAGIIFLGSAIVLRSWIGGLLVLIPLGLAVLINFGVMGLTGITLGIGTAAISAMAVGIGADYAIYLLFRIREEYRNIRKERSTAGSIPIQGSPLADPLASAIQNAVVTAGKAIVFVAFSIAAGYAILPFSGYYLHMEGILVPLAMLTSCAGALVLLSTLVYALKPKFILRG